MTVDPKHPRLAAGISAGGRWTRAHHPEGPGLEVAAEPLHIMGVTDEQTECDRCGKLELQRTAIVHDADGAEVGRYGTSCVSQVLGTTWTAVAIDKLEAGRRHRVVTELRHSAAHLTKDDPDMAAECLADARSYGLHREDELERWDELFAQIPPAVYNSRPLFMTRLGAPPVQPAQTPAPTEATISPPERV